jgi:type II secretory pathway component PulJ
VDVDNALAPVFIAIIAIVGIMQAAFVVALALALRIANARMAELQETLDREIAKPIADLARMADIAVRASEQTLVHTQRMGEVVEEASAKAESVIGDFTRKLQLAGEDLEDTAEEIDEEVIEPARDQLSGVAALFRGVERAVEVWRASAPPRRD